MEIGEMVGGTKQYDSVLNKYIVFTEMRQGYVALWHTIQDKEIWRQFLKQGCVFGITCRTAP